MSTLDPFTTFDRFFGTETPSRQGGVMPLDAFQKDEKYVVRVDLPGISPDDIDINVERNVLTITVERSPEDTDDVTWLVRERPSGRHSRQIRLGASLDSGNIEADYEQGVLTVTIPTREDAKPRQIKVKTDNKAIDA
ncbi:Hsp20/alpha crystallin family protein [soil metagenome]